MPGQPGPALSLPTRFLRFIFFLLYQPFAWSYDLVAWVVSLGQWKPWIYATLPYLPGARILELGHGPGHLQVALQRSVRQVFGLDLSPQMGLLASKRLKRARFDPRLCRGQAQFLPYPISSFDHVVSTFPSEYIFAQETLAEIKRVLKHNGSVVVLPVAWLRGQKVLRRLAAWLFRVTGQAEEWTSNFSSNFRLAGFQVEEQCVQLAGSEVMLVIATSLEK